MRVSHTLAFAVSAIALCWPAAAHAQSDEINSIVACSTIENDAERLACYDSAVRPLAGRGEDLIVVGRQELEAVERDGFGLELPNLPRLSFSLFANRGGDDLETSSDQASEAPRVDEAPSQTAQAQAQVLDRTDDGQIDRIRLQVASIDRRGYNDLFFTMTNGQVWERVAGPNLARLPDPEREEIFVEIRRAAVGSYLMQINGRGAAHRVQRRQ